MKLSSHLSRRIVAGLSLASAAILLPTAALASSSTAGAPARPAVATCTAIGTRLWWAVPSDGTAGSSYFQIELSNITHATCTFYGYPGVSTLNTAGNQVGLASTGSGAKVSVTLAPGATAHFVLRVIDAGAKCAHPVNTVLLRVFGPGQFHANTVGFPSQACPGQRLLYVDAVHPGAGIPGYTIN